MCSIAEEALEQLKMSLSKVKSGKTIEIDEKVGFELYDGSYREISTRSDLSIGEVRINVRIDYPSPKPIQSFDFGGSRRIP